MMDNKPEILKEMLKDMEGVPMIYRPSNYWANYQRESYNYINNRGIAKFRSNENTLWSSFGAVAGPLLGQARPLLADLKQAKNSQIATIFFKVGRQIPSVRRSLAMIDKASIWEKLTDEYENQLRHLLELSYYYCLNRDEKHLLTQISDSGLGAPSIIMSINGNKYTLHFLRYFLQYLYLSRFIDFRTLHGIIEIGGGYGGLAEVILKLNPQIVYVNVDIPPQIYIAQQYLDACFPGKVSTYVAARDEIQAAGKLDIQNYSEGHIFTLCPWQLPSLTGKFELFINSASFQEMEPDIVENYATSLKRLVDKYGYIRAVPEGVGVAKKPGEAGVLKKVTRDHYISYFDTFELVDESHAEVLPKLPGTFDLYRDLFFIARRR